MSSPKREQVHESPASAVLSIIPVWHLIVPYKRGRMVITYCATMHGIDEVLRQRRKLCSSPAQFLRHAACEQAPSFWPRDGHHALRRGLSVVWQSGAAHLPKRFPTTKHGPLRLPRSASPRTGVRPLTPLSITLYGTSSQSTRHGLSRIARAVKARRSSCAARPKHVPPPSA